eukprot:Nitzschia sp. Nitz4//scaffold120_size68122//43268//44092//NITZ4_006049-RA/size68122-processed-gene-0.38-mRNA-1//1//CDS//3329534293//669//frame0
MSSSPRKTIRGVLIDLSGTVHQGEALIPGAIEALERLRQHGKKLRFVTNTSTKSSFKLLEHLHNLSPATPIVKDPEQEFVTSVLATKRYIQQQGWKPYCLMEDTRDLLPETSEEDTSTPPNCVVVGLAPTKFDYEHMNQAFRILQENSGRLLAIHKAPYVRDAKDGRISLGPGGFCAALELAAACTATVMGKPSKEFFQSAMWEDIDAEETCMIGDDVMQDVHGAHMAGIGTCLLVQTGKYQSNDEQRAPEAVTRLCASIVEAVDYILQPDNNS